MDPSDLYDDYDYDEGDSYLDDIDYYPHNYESVENYYDALTEYARPEYA